MATITDTLLTLAQDMRDAIATIRGVLSEVRAIKDAAQDRVTTIINNFNQRPAVRVVWVDPTDGLDTNDGSTPALARRSIDAVLADLGTDAVAIYLFGDVTIRRRHPAYGSLTFTGAQRASNATGFIKIQRTVTFLGTAENSPSADGTTFSAGLSLSGPAYVSDYVDYRLPDQTAGQTYSAHLYSDVGARVTIFRSTLTVASATAKALLGSRSLTLNAFLNLTLGGGAAGHLFEGVAAGGDPNSLFYYRTNVGSA